MTMDTDYLLDTSFLIGLESEASHGVTEGPAMQFLKNHEAAVLHISVVTYAEMCTAFSAEATELRDQILGRYHVVHITERIAWQYSGEFVRQRAAQGPMLAANDLWTASTALVLGYPLVARGGNHFRSVHGLTVISV